MTLRILPDFLLSGDNHHAHPRPDPDNRMRAAMGTPLRHQLRAARVDIPADHAKLSPEARATLQWMAHVDAGRIGK